MPTNELPPILLDQYLADECLPVDVERVKEWLLVDKRHELVLREVIEVRRHVSRDPKWNVKAMWQQVANEIGDQSRHVKGPSTAVHMSNKGVRHMQRDDSQISPLLNGISRTIESQEQESKPRRHRLNYSRWLAVGTAALIAIGTSVVVNKVRNSATGVERSMSTHVVTTVRGQRAEIQLPDGTVVLLGPDTRLRYTEDLTGGNRMVDLQGEALFTVTHSVKTPFIVRTKELTVRVLGTTFAVRRYSDDTVASVIVLDGRVAVSSDNTEWRFPSTALNANDRAQVMPDGLIVRDQNVDARKLISWTVGQLDFTGIPFHVVVTDVARLYDLDLDVTVKRLRERRITGAINDSQSPSDVLNMLADMVGARIERHGKIFTFVPR